MFFLVIYCQHYLIKEDDKMYNYKKVQKETLKTLKQIDQNVWVMNYKCPYGLDAILEQGTKGIMEAVIFLQKENAVWLRKNYPR